MPKKIIAEFKIPYIQIMDETGRVDEELMTELNDELVMKMYEKMIFSRTVDEICLKLQREGRLGVYAPIRGQEASQIGSALALEKDDWFFPMYRDVGTMLTFGLSIEKLFLSFTGDERGMNVSEELNMFPFAVPVASQVPIAVGAAIATNILKKKNAVLTHLGDGATSKADFLEGSNFAGVFNAPVVIICDNNQYAISVPRKQQTISQTIAQKSIAFGFQGVQVDGNDVFAMYKVTKEAIEKAKQGKGPTFIEAVTYRLADHTTADDARKYRNEEEVREWEKKDPILRLELFMKSKEILNDEKIQKLKKDAETKITEVVNKVEKTQGQKIEDLFSYLYEKMPKKLVEQMSDMKENFND